MNRVTVLLTMLTTLVAARAFEAEVETQAIFDRWKNRIEHEHPECLKTWPITDDERDAYYLQHTVTNTSTFRCYLHCIYKAFNLVNEGGSANRDGLYRTFERMTYQMVDYCAGRVVEKDDSCEKSFELADCLLHYEGVYS